MVASSKPVAPSGGEEQVGFSIEPIRFAIWNDYLKLSNHQKNLILENARFKGFVRVKTALDALNDMYSFIEDSGVSIKNLRHYHNAQLKEFDKFLGFYFEPQFLLLNEALDANLEKIEVGQNGFSINHYIRWKQLCRLFLEISGISKYERPQSLSPELGFGAS